MERGKRTTKTGEKGRGVVKRRGFWYTEEVEQKFGETHG
jgi:hypothetical protein